MIKYKKLVKNILLFALSSFIPKLITFFLVPIYTAYLTTEEYGISDLINVTVSLFIPILTLNIRDAVLRFSLDKKYNQKDCFNISLRIVFFDLIILLIFTFLQIYFRWFNINLVYLVFFDILLIIESLYYILNSFYKGIENVKTIVIASIMNSLFTFLFNILFVVILKMGLLGFLLANSSGIIIAILVFLFHGKAYKYFSFHYSRIQAKEMIKYSFPMVFSAIAWWVNNASDRYLITWMIGVSASGIYAVSSKIPAILTVFQNIFMQAWSISAIKEFDKDDTDGFIGNMYTIMSSMLCLLCSIIIIFNIFISKLMFSGNFYIAWKYVPLLVLSICVDGLALFIGNLFYAVKDTKSRAYATIFGAIANLILNIILINVIGVYGAAFATFIGYLVGLIYSRIKIKKYISIKTSMKKNDFALFLLIIQTFFAYYGNKYIITQFVILLIILYLYKNCLIKIFVIIKNKVMNSSNKI